MMSVDWERIKSQRAILKAVLPVISNDKVEFVIIVEIRVCRPDGDSLVGHLTSQAQDFCSSVDDSLFREDFDDNLFRHGITLFRRIYSA